ncbi:serine hydrolase domain-containing protein [Streptomyces sp. NPDC097981]|uniref:serine hydrolase domain-containing protein n=1 Tax=Streptomyces sp. NPDC097981 TaxID=3155428 RepID=UPI00331DA1E3
MTSQTFPTDHTTATVRSRRKRLPLPGLACMALTAVVLSTAAPALAAPAASPAAVVAASKPDLPKLNAAALQAAVEGSSVSATAMLARVSGPAGQWTGTSGVADVTTGEAVPADGRFRLGSVTKMFIGTVVLQLAAEDQVELDRPVQEYLPGVLPAEYPPISVRQLLDYTSGLPELTAGDLPTDPQGIVDHRFDDHTFGELVAMAVKHPRLFDRPGSMQSYGATGYYVAALLVEKLTGRSYQREITDRILLPLNLRHTTAPETDTTIPGPHAHGYIDLSPAHDKTGLVDITEQNPGAGGMISTGADLDRFLTALFRGRLLPPPQLDEMFTVPNVPYLGGSDQDPGHGRAFYGAGPMRVTFPNGVTVRGKTGSTFGYTDGMFATRDLKRRLVYSFNPVTGGGNDRRIVNQIITAAFGS